MDIEWINHSPYLIAFFTGLFGGVHCVGMCGGIVSILSFSQQPRTPLSSPSNHLFILLSYNLGRISAYALAGALLGGFGAGIIDLLGLDQSKRILSVIAAIFMLLLGVYLAGFWNTLTRLEQLGTKLWQVIEPFSRRFIPVHTVQHAFPLGFFWGWLPCGLVYTILIMSLSVGGAIEGALLMLAFGLGTLPNLLAMGIVATRLLKWTRHPKVRLVAGLLVIILGLVTLLSLHSASINIQQNH
ncbi:MAG: sulfite exporter TauE/SafE family protein [Cocleimonas sp.]|nr:sulfite exporter TauE/SafE family protein [Cocleimonas sp.]